MKEIVEFERLLESMNQDCDQCEADGDTVTAEAFKRLISKTEDELLIAKAHIRLIEKAHMLNISEE